jgi:hypothetical protein
VVVSKFWGILQLSVKPINGKFLIEGTCPFCLASPNKEPDQYQYFSPTRRLCAISLGVCMYDNVH